MTKEKIIELIEQKFGEELHWEEAVANELLALIEQDEKEVARLQKAEESAQESSVEYYNLYKDYKRKYDDLKHHEFDLLKEFVEYIKQSWQEEINTYERFQKGEDCSYIAREAIKSKLIGMRKMLGLLDHDLEKFLEDKKLISLLDEVEE